MKKQLAMLLMLVLVCVCLTGCVMGAVVVDKNENEYPINAEGGTVPTEGTLIMMAGNEVEAMDLISGESQGLAFRAVEDTEVIFNPIHGGKKCVVKGKDIAAEGFYDNEWDVEGLAIAVPYELSAGTYRVIVKDEEGLETSTLKFQVYQNGEAIEDGIIEVHSIMLASREEMQQRTVYFDTGLNMTVSGSVATGDASHLVMWLALVGVGCAGLVVLMMKKRTA